MQLKKLKKNRTYSAEIGTTYIMEKFKPCDKINCEAHRNKHHVTYTITAKNKTPYMPGYYVSVYLGRANTILASRVVGIRVFGEAVCLV